VDGEVVEVLPHPHLGDWAGAGVDLEVSWEVELHRDGWILAEAGWTLDDPELPGGLYAELAPGHVPLGFTNPVRVDVDGDGRWSAPGL